MIRRCRRRTVTLDRAIFRLTSFLRAKTKAVHRDLSHYAIILLKPVNDIRFICLIKKNESGTIILFVGITYCMRDLLSDFNNYA